MLAEAAGLETGYQQFERAALAVIDGADRQAAMAWLGELGQGVDETIDRGDLERVARWSARIDRLAANLPEGELARVADGYLSAMLHRLDRAAASLAQRQDVAERDEAARSVRDRVYAVVRQRPRSRSGEIAAELGLAASQASRALRELERRGQVFRAEPDPADHDKRVRRYIAAVDVHAASAA
jgi:hypothetical protein